MSLDLRRAILHVRGAGQVIAPARADLSERQRLAVDVQNAIIGAQQNAPRPAVAPARAQPLDLSELERVLADTRKLG